MNKDSHESELQKQEYSFALNANFHDEHGNGPVVLQNEPSNIKCTTFKPGYVVIGHKYDINSNRTYFFLTNPTTKDSEIGYIDGNQNIPTESFNVNDCNCDPSAVLDPPLEKEQQIETCNYETVISDICNGVSTYKLNFSIDYPLYETNIQLKDEKVGKALYFTDNYNPPRYIQLDYLNQYYKDIDPCTGDEIDACLDVDKMRIFKLFNKPCSKVDVIIEGGSLKAGMYEVIVAYSDSDSNILSSWYSLTNPTPIFDKNNNILDQTNLDYMTSKGFSVEFTDLDKNYNFFTIGVIYRSGLDLAVSYFTYGTYPIDTSKITIFSLDDRPRNVTLADFLVGKPFYKRSQGMTNSNGFLFQYGVEQQREINLQPVVNLMGAYAKWTTYIAKENLYEDGANVSNFTGYMRDEVYPYGIKFFMKGGYETPLFPLIPRPSKEWESVEATSPITDDTGIKKLNKECSDLERDKLWQYANTATKDPDICTTAPGLGIETKPISRPVQGTCVVSQNGVTTVVDQITNGAFTIVTNLNAIDYINSEDGRVEMQVAKEDGDLQFNELLDILDNPAQYSDSCEPLLAGTCVPADPIIEEEEMFALSVNNLKEITTLMCLSEPNIDQYSIRAQSPPKAYNLEIDFTTGNPVQDTDFIQNYFGGSVFDRKDVSNMTPTDAKAVPFLQSPQIDFPQFIEQSGHLSPASANPSYKSVINADFLINKVNANAIWYTVSLENTTSTIVELTRMKLHDKDDLTLDPTKLRITVYDGEPTQTTTPNFVKFITLTETTNLDELIFMISKEDGVCQDSYFPQTKKFKKDLAYIAIDTTQTKKESIAVKIPKFNGLAIHLSKEDDDYGDRDRGIFFYQATPSSAVVECGACKIQDTLALGINNSYNGTATGLDPGFADFLSQFGLKSEAVGSIFGQAGDINAEFLIAHAGPDSTFPYMMGWKNRKGTGAWSGEGGVKPSGDPGDPSGWFPTSASITFQNPSLTISYTVPTSKTAENNGDVQIGRIFPPKNAEEFAKKLLEANATQMSQAGILGFVNDEGVMVFRGPIGFTTSGLNYRINPDSTTPGTNPFYPGGNILGLGYGLKLEIDPTIAGLTIINRPTRGVFNIYQRDPVYKREVTFDLLTFGKKQTRNYICTYEIPILDNCIAVPYAKGDFSYWESTEKYPCNLEMFDSSNLKISLSDIPQNKRSGLEYYATQNLATSKFDWKLDQNNEPLVNFADREIRHYKYPDNTLIPFMSDDNMAPDDFKSSNIFPLGFTIDKEVIAMFLDVAENNGLITKEERDSIVSYEIFRGDRRIDRSIIAKGLLFDMYRATDPDEYYPNYPLNTLGRDSWNGQTQDHMYNSVKNNIFTFHSPNTHFSRPTLPGELQIDGIVYGKSRLMYDEVRGHSTYILLGRKAKNLAVSLALAESFFESAAYTGDVLTKGAAGGNSSFLSVAVSIIAVAAFAAAQVIKTGQYRLEWLKTLKNLGSPRNFAYYQTAIGYYNYLTPYEKVDANTLNFEAQYAKKIRGIEAISYLKEGMWQVANERSSSTYKVNNLDREDSVFIAVQKHFDYPSKYYTYDNESVARKKSSRRGYSGTGRSSELIGNCASMYGTLKRYNPSQYGFIHSIEWLSTGYCRTFEDEFGTCDAVFGGDTYISRFSVKRKFPFFTSNAIGLAPLVPFAYSNYFNINPKLKQGGTRFFLNYEIDTNLDSGFSVGALFFPSNDSELSFDYYKGNNMYVTPPSKFYLFSYGFPYFLVESEINCNYRYARREPYENFYPNIPDVIEFTQEQNVSIREPNTYFYNRVYSSAKSKSRYSLFPTNYTSEYYNKVNSGKNTVIYSAQDSSETDFSDAWLQYAPNDYYIFPSSYGNLVDMFGIESEQVLARFTNGVSIFGAVDVLKDRLTPETRLLGAGGIFNARAMSFNKTELGYAGTQHKAKISCSFGHYYVDAMRGKVFNLKPSGQGVDDITVGLEKWFKQNLPFNCIKTFSDINTDNNFKNIGITLGWDDRFKRLFLTKRDYKIVKNPVGKPELKFNKLDGFHTQLDPNAVKIAVPFSDTAYFKDCSFTVGYSPLTESWISYYSFKPNFYITYNDYFQTGLNYPNDPTEKGLWSHFPFTSSYQVFYGKLYPFTVEYPMLSAFSQSSISTIEYWLEARKYYNQWDFADAFGIGFNKAIVYNATQNTGLLNLNHQKNNDLSQQVKFPKYNPASTDILQTEIGGKWAFNYLYNIVKNEKSMLPIWLNDISNVDKFINSSLLNYKPTFKDRMRGDYFLVRMSQDIESRFKLLFRFAVDERDFYEQ